MSDVLTVAEHRQGELRPVSHELVTAGRELADANGGELHVAVISGDVDAYAEAVNRTGVDAIHTVEHGEEFNHDVYSQAVEQLYADLDPQYLVMPHTVNGLDYAPAVATSLDLPLATDVIDFSHNGSLSVTREKLETAFAVRVAGQYQCARLAAQDMADGDGGTILWTTSQQARVPRGGVASVTARQAVRGTARAMAHNLGEHGIQSIHVVVDGWIANPTLRERYPDHDDWMDPDEIAGVYRDLADDPETVHASEIDLRHPNDELRF